jgi:hypothetical protein
MASVQIWKISAARVLELSCQILLSESLACRTSYLLRMGCPWMLPEPRNKTNTAGYTSRSSIKVQGRNAPTKGVTTLVCHRVWVFEQVVTACTTTKPLQIIFSHLSQNILRSKGHV